MNLRTRNKVNAGFSMASMTDIVFLLLIFFMIASTLIAPNALDLLLPQSSYQTDIKAYTTVSITEDLIVAVERDVVDFESLEQVLRQKLSGVEEPTISLHAEKSVPIEYVVKVMNIAKDNRYRVILATSPK
ncbi:MAG: biopolymer transporter ExbD [Bacteroidota bacterium]